MGTSLLQISFLALPNLNSNQKKLAEGSGEKKKSLRHSLDTILQWCYCWMISGYVLLTLLAGKRQCSVLGRRSLCCQGSEVCLCVFQACSDEEDAENDDLNDAGESSSNTPLFNGENQDFIPPQRILGLWKLGLCREQPCNIQQRQHKSEQRGWRHRQGLTGYFKLKMPNFPEKSLENGQKSPGK